MNDEENGTRANRSECEETFLLSLMNQIALCYGEGVIKRQFRHLKTDAMLFQVSSVLLFAPLEAHAVSKHENRQCTYRCQY